MKHLSKVLLFLCLLMSTPAWSATFYVAKDCTGGSSPPNCSDSNNGTSRQTAELTIAAGLAHLSAGDTLIIGDGTFLEHIASAAVPEGSVGAPTIIRAENNRQAILRPTSGSGVIVHILSKDYITLDGLDVDAVGVGGQPVWIECPVGSPCSNINMINGRYRNADGTNSGVSYDGTNGLIQNNLFEDCGNDPLGHCLYLVGSSNIVDGNTMDGTGGYCLHLYSTDRSIDSNIIRNNTVSNCADQAGMIIGSGDNNLVYNNIVHSSVNGIQIRHNGGTNNQLYFNTIYGSGQCIHIFSDQSNAIVRNNICDGGGTDDVIDDGTGSTITHNRCDSACGSNSTTATPSFTNAASNDFTLLASSAMIDIGLTLGPITDDIIGTSRPQGGGVDLGAYEFIIGGGGSGYVVDWTLSASSPWEVVTASFAPSGTIARISGQAANNPKTSTAEDSSTLAFPSNVTAGRLLIVAGAAYDETGVASITVTDTRLTPYQVLSAGSLLDGNLRVFLAYGIAPTSGANTVTVNPAGDATDAVLTFSIDEFSGVDTATPLDFNGGSATGTGIQPTDTLDTATNGILIAGVMTHTSGANPTIDVGAGYTLIGEYEDNTITTHSLEYRLLAGGGGGDTGSPNIFESTVIR